MKYKVTITVVVEVDDQGEALRQAHIDIASQRYAEAKIEAQEVLLPDGRVVSWEEATIGPRCIEEEQWE